MRAEELKGTNMFPQFRVRVRGTLRASACAALGLIVSSVGLRCDAKGGRSNSFSRDPRPSSRQFSIHNLRCGGLGRGKSGVNPGARRAWVLLILHLPCPPPLLFLLVSPSVTVYFSTSLPLPLSSQSVFFSVFPPVPLPSLLIPSRQQHQSVPTCIGTPRHSR